MNISRKQLFVVVFFVTTIVLTRTILKIAPNVEFVTALSFSAAYFIKNKYVSVFSLLAAMFLSDILIGNTSIYIFTWTGFLFPILLGFVLSTDKFQSFLSDINAYLKNFLIGLNVAILSSILFFLWTNVGVVIMSSMYTMDLNGILSSYINALPFLKNQIIGNIILVPLFVVIFTYFTILLKRPTNNVKLDIVQNNKSLHN